MRLVLLLALALTCNVSASYCNGKPNPAAKPNLNAIDSSPPTLVRTVKNGKLYHVGTGDDKISLVHLYGTAYEKGFAHGAVLKNDTAEFYSRVIPYFEETILQAINGSVPWLPKLSLVSCFHLFSLSMLKCRAIKTSRPFKPTTEMTSKTWPVRLWSPSWSRL